MRHLKYILLSYIKTKNVKYSIIPLILSSHINRLLNNILYRIFKISSLFSISTQNLVLIKFQSAEIKMIWGKCWFFMTWLEAGPGQHSDDAEAVSVTIVLSKTGIVLT